MAIVFDLKGLRCYINNIFLYHMSTENINLFYHLRKDVSHLPRSI